MKVRWLHVWQTCMRQINESVVVSEACERLLGEIRKSSLNSTLLLGKRAPVPVRAPLLWSTGHYSNKQLRPQVITNRRMSRVHTAAVAPPPPTPGPVWDHPCVDLCDEKNRRTAVTCRTDRGSSADGTSLFTVKAVEDRAIIMAEYSLLIVYWIVCKRLKTIRNCKHPKKTVPAPSIEHQVQDYLHGTR